MDTPTGEALFHLDLTIGVLICKSCRFAVNPITILKHLQQFHSTIHFQTRKELADSLSTLPIASCLEQLAWRPGGQALPHIAIARGFKCLHCGKCLISEDTMARHMRERHAGSVAIEKGVRVQQIFAQPKTLVEVREPDEGPAEDITPVELYLEAALSRYKDTMTPKDETLPTDVGAAHLTPWLVRTGWVEHLGGLSPARLKALTDLPGLGGEEPALKRLCAWTVEVLRDCHLGAQAASCPTTIRCTISANTTADIGMKPESFDVQEATLTKYFRYWQHFLCYLFRASSDPVSSRLVLTDGQQEMVEDLKTCVSTATAETEAAVKEQLLRLSVSIFEQPLTSWAMKSPLIHFLSIQAINHHNKTFSTPQEFTPTLFGLIFVGRILMLEKAIPLASRADDEFVPHFRKYHQEHLISGSLSTMRELISIRAYGMSIAANQHSKPTCHWSRDWSQLYYLEHVISMEKVRSMSKPIIQLAQTELLEHLVARPPSYLQTRDPSKFVDNLTWCANEQCFADLNDNGLKGGGERVLRWLQEGGKLDGMLTVSGPVQFAYQNVQTYIDHVENFLDRLMFLCHTLGGMPARGTEFATLKIRNSWTTMRNFYVVNGTLMFLTEYHKGQSRTESPKLIPRFVPQEVAQLAIAYIADVQPFVDFLDNAMQLGSVTTSKHVMWGWKSKTRDTEHLSKTLAKFTGAHLGVALTVASWRQVAITVERDRVRPSMDAVHREFSDLQAGHSEAIAEHHYGVRADLLSSLSDSTMRQMRTVSERWHRFMLQGRFPIPHRPVTIIVDDSQPPLAQAVVPTITPIEPDSSTLHFTPRPQPGRGDEQTRLRMS